MKKIIFMLLLALLAPQLVQGQETIYLSNLSQTSTGTDAVGSDSWLAMDFGTGNNSGGYLLDSVQLAMTDASGNPGDFAVMLYAANGSVDAVLPGSNLGTLSGSAGPTVAGIYTYTPASSFTLSPRTVYFIVLTAGTTIANGAYKWNLAADSYNPIEGWAVGNLFAHSSNGLFWQYSNLTFAQFALAATAIPEPSSVFLFLLGSGVLLYVRRIFHR